MYNVYKYLIGGSKAETNRLFSVVPTNRTEGNGHKLKHIKFHLNARKHFSIVRVTKHWNRLLKEFVETPPEESKPNWTYLGNLL